MIECFVCGEKFNKVRLAAKHVVEKHVRNDAGVLYCWCGRTTPGFLHHFAHHCNIEVIGGLRCGMRSKGYPRGTGYAEMRQHFLETAMGVRP